MRARRSLDSAVGQHLKTSSPLARRSSWKTIRGRRNDGDGLPATEGVSDVSSMVSLPCGWLRLSTKTRFLCPCSGAVREGGLPGEESLPRPLRPYGAWLRKWDCCGLPWSLWDLEVISGGMDSAQPRLGLLGS
ncbi:hypothetical protein G5714_004337 [Onychostoma macrolepis]|uniref:Uncharacterized protein n=1 Tax=Onychostoma macrolepis TaxID=369639 RepID=A0A7J6D568_9TELE|nr:hypothetical protein G5714_004337 [Onychostoma macrolepis]